MIYDAASVASKTNSSARTLVSTRTKSNLALKCIIEKNAKCELATSLGLSDYFFILITDIQLAIQVKSSPLCNRDSIAYLSISVLYTLDN